MRVKIDWSTHQLDIVKNDEILIHDLNVNNSSFLRVKFINTQGVCVVTGDFGNWIFCREFHPVKGAKVSDAYWIEKCSQKGRVYDPESTGESIINEIKDVKKDYDNYKEPDTIIDYYEGCLRYSDDYYAYTDYAYNNMPSFLDIYDVIIVEKTKHRLEIIFDAFEEICNRI